MPETTSGLWSASDVYRRVNSQTWVSDDDFVTSNGMALVQPSSVVSFGVNNSTTISQSGSVAFSNCTSFYLNDVFSASFEIYFVSLKATATGNAYVRFQLVTSTGTQLGGLYQKFQVTDTTYSLTRSTSYEDNMVLGQSTPVDTTYYPGMYGVIYAPYLAKSKVYRAVGADSYSYAGINNYAGVLTTDISTTGILFTSYFSQGTEIPLLSGTVSIYGLVGA